MAAIAISPAARPVVVPRRRTDSCPETIRREARDGRSVQPSASAVALNRVLGPDPSLIQGQLTANRQVFLLNPNGVLFSPTAQVNVGGLVASTLKLSNEDFMAGPWRFDGDSTAEVPTRAASLPQRGGYGPWWRHDPISEPDANRARLWLNLAYRL